MKCFMLELTAAGDGTKVLLNAELVHYIGPWKQDEGCELHSNQGMHYFVIENYQTICDLIRQNGGKIISAPIRSELELEHGAAE